MKKVLGFGILAALAVFGCQVEEEGELAPEGKVFMATTEAYFADGVETKTSMDADGNVLWKRGDQVSIFVGRTINDQYQVADANDGRTEAAMSLVSSPGFVAGSAIDNNVAIYPYSSTTFLNKEEEESYSISGRSLPEKQNYENASFGNGAFPMVAVTSSRNDYNLKFKNVLGGLKLQMKGTATIKSISITGNNNDRLCGDAEINVSTTTAPSISLNDESAKIVTLDCGNGVQLNETAATAFIIALPPMTMTGGFTVTVTDTYGATMEIKTTKKQTITRSNLLTMPAVNYTAPVPDAVDLGLTSGLKWATRNVGASNPGEYGDYFAWGATEPYYASQEPLVWKDGKEEGYFWTVYPFRTSGDSKDTVKFSKYNTSSSCGTVDNKTVLDPEDDAAHVNWGSNWRIPTDEEWTELKTECTWTWTTQNGVSGSLVTGPNGNSIFLPAAGFRYYTPLHHAGSLCYYWSSSLCTALPPHAHNVYFRSDAVSWTNDSRYLGFSVRPVTDEGVRVSVTDISLDKSSIELDVEATETIAATVSPYNATQNNVIWSSSNTSVAIVSWEGVVTAIAPGTATITATTYDGGLTAMCIVTVPAPPAPGTENGYEWVDLGLPSGLKWATCNVGANSPEDYGDYFAWGGTEPQSSYDWTTCPFRTSGDSYNNVKFSKYNTHRGTIDNKTILDPDDDAAHVNCGGSWRMPTDAEWTELLTECTWTLTTQNGVNGRLVTGPNGNSIFLPAAGSRSGTSLSYTDSNGYYRSSSLCTGNTHYAWGVAFSSGDANRGGGNRCDGQSVRPVTDEGVRISVTGISLDKSFIALDLDETAIITATVAPSNATQKDVIWSSSDTSVAIVSWEGVVTVVATGTATITATTYDGGFTATCTVTYKAYAAPEPVSEAVDLGLTSGLKWATCNLGSTAPEEYGDYFAWGETAPYYKEGHSQDDPCSNWKANKTGYNWTSYKWCIGSYDTLTKYCTSRSYGTIDNNIVLDPDDDAAHVNWGGSWRMPTDAEWTELRTECTWTWTAQNGVNGSLVTGPNGNSIFLPAAGYRDEDDARLNESGSYGYYLSSSLSTDYPHYAWYVSFWSSSVYRADYHRCYGRSVRPVSE